MTNLLGYIDGDHDVMKKQLLAILNVFQDFTGYNVPEQSKHRKRGWGAQNLEQPKLASFFAELYDILLTP